MPEDARTWHSDATYKVTWHGYPLLVAGYTDRANHFHLAAVSLCSTEKSSDFAPLFQSIYDRRPDLLPTMLLTDASESMYNALPKEWSHVTRGMCYVHVYRNVENAAKKYVKSQSKRILFLREFGDLSAAWNLDSYLKVRSLLIEKYSTDPEVTNVLDHYVRTWCTDRLQNHFSGSAPGCSMHNNGLEGENGAIKFIATDYKQMSVTDFCMSISKFIQAESLEKDPKSNNYRPYLRNPEIKCSTYTSVANAITNKRYFIYESTSDTVDSNFYAVASREAVDEDAVMFENAIRKFKNSSWESFDDFTFSTKRIKILVGSTGQWRCTCYKFSREHHCVHSLLLSYLGNEKSVVDKVLENTRLARTKKARGDTKKARPAQTRQANTPVLAGGIVADALASKVLTTSNGSSAAGRISPSTESFEI